MSLKDFDWSEAIWAEAAALEDSEVGTSTARAPDCGPKVSRKACRTDRKRRLQVLSLSQPTPAAVKERVLMERSCNLCGRCPSMCSRRAI